MIRYTLDQLADPATYVADETLATLARRVAASTNSLPLSIGERKRLAMAGGMAAAVYEAVCAACDAAEAAAAADDAHRAALASLPLPASWTVTIGADYAEFRGPIDERMNDALSRHGTWSVADRAWRVPVAKGSTLARSLKRAAGPAATAARADRAEQRRRADTERWLGYVEEKAREGYLYRRGVDECQGRAIGDFPDLRARLDAALATCAQRSAEAARQRAEQAEQDAASRAERAQAASRRMLHLLSQAPAIGLPCRLHGSAVVYTGAGRTFHVDEDHPSLWGEHLLGHEGEPCAYFYYRAATTAELSQLVAAEAAAPGHHAPNTP